MKHIVSVALAASLLNGTAVMAQPNNTNRDIQGHYDQGRNDQNRNDPGSVQDGKDQKSNERNPSNRDIQNNSSVQSNHPRWSRGDRIPDQYRQNQYVVGDWQQRGFRRPPRGYRWVRNDNNDFFLAAITTGLIAATVYQEDRNQRWRQRYSRNYTYNDDTYYNECRSSPDPAGVITGALIGGLLGNAVGRGGGRGGATVAGIVVGGMVGAALTRNLNCEDRSYAYKSYYDGFNSGRPNSDWQWNNPTNSHRGNFRVGNYYNDPDGFRCATYSQVIYVQGNPQETRGRACQQPDDTWAIVN